MHYIMQGIFRTRGCSLSCEFFWHSNISIGLRFVRMVQSIHLIVCEHMLQKEMECVPMILMTQMTQFMQKNIILQNLRKTDNIEVQVYITFR